MLNSDQIEQFYKSKIWKDKRLYILQRDNFLCQECICNGKVSIANTVHHKKHLKDYPHMALDDNNLESVCASCHNILHPEKHKQEDNPIDISNIRVIKI